MEKHKNIEFYIQRQKNFKFWKILKLEKFLQLRNGCMYYNVMIVTSSINMDPYQHSSKKRRT